MPNLHSSHIDKLTQIQDISDYVSLVFEDSNTGECWRIIIIRSDDMYNSTGFYASEVIDDAYVHYLDAINDFFESQE